MDLDNVRSRRHTPPYLGAGPEEKSLDLPAFCSPKDRTDRVGNSPGLGEFAVRLYGFQQALPNQRLNDLKSLIMQILKILSVRAA